MIPLAHIAGMPVEETILGLAPAGAALLAALRLAFVRLRRAITGAASRPRSAR